MIGLFLCIFLGFAVSYYLTNKNYNPLKALVDLFKGQQKNDTSDSTAAAPVNEYQWLELQVQSFFKEHSDIKHNLTENQKILRQYYLFRLLEYPLEEAGKAVEHYVPRLTDSHHIVLLFSIEGMEAGEQAEEEAGRFWENILMWNWWKSVRWPPPWPAFRERKRAISIPSVSVSRV